MLLRVANTILCNYSMVYNTGLLNGKMGVCLFFYEYARYTGIMEYEEIADGILDSILETLHIGNREDEIVNIVGIGIGLIYLLNHGFLEDTNDNDALKDVDEIIKKIIRTSKFQTVKLIHAAFYFICRYRYYRVGVNRKECYSLTAYLIEILSHSNLKENDMIPSSISAYILHNATLINKMARTSRTISKELILPSSTIGLVYNIEMSNTDWMWYGLLMESDSCDNYKIRMDLSTICRECFYDAEHSIDILCRIGLFEIKDSH